MKNRLFKKISLFALFFIAALTLFVGSFNASAYDLGKTPVGISMTYYDDIDSRGFTWQTSTDVTETILLVTQQVPGQEVDWNSVTPITGSYNDLNGYRCHKAQVVDLPAGDYLYKVGSSEAYSEVGKFTIDNTNDNKVSFTYVTDSQDTSVEGFKTFGNTLKNAMAHNPSFITFAGDIVDNSHANWGNEDSLIKMEEWIYAYEANKEVSMSIPMMSAAGNHESAGYQFVYHNNIEYDKALYTGGYYSFDYENIHFTVLDTNVFERSDEAETAAQLAWVEQDLASTTKPWKIVMMHIGAYSTGDHSNDSSTLRIRDMLPPIFAKYKVDLVLQGHDHVYSRTMPYYYGENEDGKTVNRNEKFIKEDGINWSQEPDGTYYITINTCGNKTYPPVNYDSSRIFPAKSPVNGKPMSQQILDPMFAHIEVDGDRLLLKSYISKAEGEELYDYIAIQKNTHTAFINAVNSLEGELKLEDAKRVQAVKQAYENLSARALNYVPAETVNKLNEILTNYNLVDNLAAYEVIESINKLDTDDYSGEFLVNYKTACQGYYSLTEAQKALVKNKDLLLSIRGKLAEIEDEMTSKYLVEGVQGLIDAISTAENQEEARLIANAAYDLLSDDEKALIVNTDLLKQPEPEKKGCKGSIYAPLASIVLLGGVIILSRRKRGDYNEEN